MAKKITITLDNWKLSNWKQAVITAYVNECNAQGGVAQKDMATELGVGSSSTVSGYISEYKLEYKRPAPAPTPEALEKMANILRNSGYGVAHPAIVKAPNLRTATTLEPQI